MFPFDREKRVRKPSMFGEFDSFFSDFEEQMGRMMQNALSIRLQLVHRTGWQDI
jgi:hypothetical protein